MPRYFLHFDVNSRLQEDDLGTEFLTDNEMRKETRRVLAALAKDDLAKDGETATYKVLVCDTEKRPVYAAVMTLVAVELRRAVASDAA